MRTSRHWLLVPFVAVCALLLSGPALAQDPVPTSELTELKKSLADAQKDIAEAKSKGDTAWMLTASAFVMLMLPGLALFYGGMVRRKNVLATMMHSMGALAVVGLYWIAVGYALAFGPSVLTINLWGVENGGLVGWDPRLIFLHGIDSTMTLPGGTIPVYVHMMFQGMFAIITPALISGAIAERVRFWPFCLFMVLWVTFVYCPLAHMVWAFDWFYATPLDAAKGAGASAVGLLGKLGALDFAGGTVVHIAAGMAGLAACLILRKREGYPKAAIHPNSMVLTLLGAGLLWFGWFGFNGGSATASNALAGSAFAATQAAAAAAGVGWMVIEWLHKGKPTALGLASGIVAGLVAVTPASGFVLVWGGVAIGLAAALFCYVAVYVKGELGYDDSLDAFGIHGVGGFVGAVLTGVFCYAAVQSASVDGYIASGSSKQFLIQLKAASFATVFALVLSAVLVFVTQAVTLGNFTTDTRSEVDGLDRTEHGEVGFDLGYATETVAFTPTEPKAATYPKGNGRFEVAVEGVNSDELLKNWTALCQPTEAPPDPDFLAVYPHVTTVSGNTFRLRGGDPAALTARMESLFKKLIPGKPVKAVRV
ncbi:MAG TPA: ammonium transporter [Fimbriiglobus sp.]|nr:ammonium transporter [Fimbriiglobus sp.]